MEISINEGTYEFGWFGFNPFRKRKSGLIYLNLRSFSVGIEREGSYAYGAFAYEKWPIHMRETDGKLKVHHSHNWYWKKWHVMLEYATNTPKQEGTLSPID